MSQYVKGDRRLAFERVPEAKIVSDLREAARHLGEPLAIKRYREQAPKRGWVADFTAVKRFGSWAAACSAAGVRSNAPLGRSSSSRFGQRECVQALKRCSQELGASPTCVSYATWAREHPEHPKAETIRYHFGRWNAALIAAGLPLNKLR